MNPAISVVIPTCRRNDLLERCLRSLARIRIEADGVELIVVDDAASGDTQWLVARLGAELGIAVRYFATRTQYGPATARNIGWRAAKAPVVAFTDDDCIPQHGWLATGMALIDSGADAVAGRVVVPLGPRPTDAQRNLAGLETAEFVTANCFCRREALEQIGGFDENYRLAWREDSDLHFALLAAGCKIERDERAVVLHPAQPARWGTSISQQCKASYDALLYKKYRREFLERIDWAPAAYYFQTTALVVFAAMLPFAPTLAAAAGAMWIAMTVRLAAIRLRGNSLAAGHVAEMLVTSAIIPTLSLFWRVRGAIRHRVLFY